MSPSFIKQVSFPIQTCMQITIFCYNTERQHLLFQEQGRDRKGINVFTAYTRQGTPSNPLSRAFVFVWPCIVHGTEKCSK